MSEERGSMPVGSPMTAVERAQVSAQVKRFLADELERDIGEMRDDAHLFDDLGLDSLLFLALFEELQGQYDVTVDTRKLARFARRNPVETLGELIDLITRIIRGEVLLD
ncbi:MAG TPA: acyl carrier protein [Candidatus Binatia bacterium]|nr:acyl carrier protein [Candidatus Binatia bacterium]